MSFELINLEDACSFIRGLTYSKRDEVDFSSNSVLRATNIDLNTSRLDLTEIRYISDEVVVKEDKKVKLNDIIICTASGSKSHLGKVALVEEELNMAFGGFMGALRVKGNILPSYLFKVLTGPDFKHQLDSLSDGANINNLKFSQICDFKFPLPSLPAQHKIVSKLDAIFAEIDKATAAAEANAKNAEALFQSYLTEVFERGGEGWTTKALSELARDDCTLSYGIVQPGDDYDKGLPIVRPTNLTVKYILRSNLKTINPSLAESYKRTTLTGEELLLCVRGTTGTVSISTKDLAGCNVTRGIVPIRFKENEMSIGYAYYYFKSSVLQKQIKSKTYGAALLQINIADVKKLQIFAPPLSKQKEIVSKLDFIFGEVDRLKYSQINKIASLVNLKNSILQQVFNGKLVKD